MARLKGVEPAEAGWFTRLVYWFVRRKFGKLTGKNRLIEPVKIAAQHPRLLRAIGQMEGGLEAARSVPAELKLLGRIIGVSSFFLGWEDNRCQRIIGVRIIGVR
jgi:hypothetical protein